MGLITTDSFGRFSIPVMLGAEDAFGAGQISVFMCDTRDDPTRERQYLDTLLGRQVDGIIVTGRRIEPRPPLGVGLRMPVVYAMTQSTGQRRAAVVPDDYGGGRLAAAHLLASGRHRIAHITGPDRFLCVRKRASGFCDAAAEADVQFSPDGPLRRVERGLGPAGSQHPAPELARRRGHLLRQRPDRPRRLRYPAHTRAAACPMTSR